jgi:hypothetical protein
MSQQNTYSKRHLVIASFEALGAHEAIAWNLWNAILVPYFTIIFMQVCGAKTTAWFANKFGSILTWNS